MPPRNWKSRIHGIIGAIEKIQRYTEGLTQEEFSRKRQVVESVVFNFIVIGEAANQVPAAIAARHDGIPWRTMRDLRNLAVHEYWILNSSILWETALNDLPPLLPLLRNVISESSQEEG